MRKLVLVPLHFCAAAAAALAVPLSTAAENAPTASRNVKPKPVAVRSLSLDSCGAASSRRLAAAVERFHASYADGIRVRALPPGAADCPAEAGYLATDDLGRSTLP